MKYLKMSLMVIGGLLAVLVVVGLLLPNTAHVERKISIQANPEKIFPYLNGYKTFNLWSPWAGIDPNTFYIYEGPTTGIGAKMSWSSKHPDVGKGSQIITKTETNKRVEINLDFMEQGQATTYYELKPQGQQTEVVWGFDTHFGWDLFARYFGLMIEQFIGPQYEKGLSKLKTLVEKK